MDEKNQTCHCSQESAQNIILEDSTGFKYRIATGKFKFPVITCRADVAFAVNKVTKKYNSSPSHCHYNVVEEVF